MSAERVEPSPPAAALSRLELALINEFVRAQGYDPLKLSDLPEPERTTLLKQASMYASARLAEVESRSHFLDEIHDRATSSSKTGL
jgi:hypothetical protein